MEELERRVRESVASLDPGAEFIDCDPALADTAEFCAHYGYPEDRSANTIVVASRRPRGHHALCVLLATTQLDVNRAVKAAMGVSKVSFAPPEVTREVTGMLIGGVTPFGLEAEIPILVDAAVLEPDWVILGGGSRSLKVRVDPAILTRLPGAEVVAGLAAPRPG